MAVATGVLTIDTTTNGATHSVSGLSFQPSVLICMVSGRTDTSDANGTANHDKSVGFAVSTSSRRCVTTQSLHNAADAACDSIGRDDCIVALLNHAAGGGTDDGKVDLQSFDSGGFTVVNDSTLGHALRLNWIAFGGTDVANSEIITVTEAGATGNQETNLVGAFQPDIVFFLGWGGTATNTAIVDSNMSWGAATGSSNQWVMAGGSDDALATTNCHCYCVTSECIALAQVTPPTTPGATTMTALAQFVSLDSDGFTINWTQRAGSRLVYALAIKGMRWQAGNLLIANTGAGNTNAKTGVGFLPLALMATGYFANATDAPQNGDIFTWGVGTSASSRVVQWITDSDNAGTTAVETGIGSGSVFKIITGGTTFFDCDITSLDSDGFTLDNNAATIGGLQPSVLYVCVADNAPVVSGGAYYYRRRRDDLAGAA